MGVTTVAGDAVPGQFWPHHIPHQLPHTLHAFPPYPSPPPPPPRQAALPPTLPTHSPHSYPTYHPHTTFSNVFAFSSVSSIRCAFAIYLLQWFVPRLCGSPHTCRLTVRCTHTARFTLPSYAAPPLPPGTRTGAPPPLSPLALALYCAHLSCHLTAPFSSSPVYCTRLRCR